jgi:hypothetical protein
VRTAGELLGEAQHLRDLKSDTTDPQVRAELRALIVALEAHARAKENGA